MNLVLPRRTALLAASAALLAPHRPAWSAQALRIGYQKDGTLVILRRQGTLEALFARPLFAPRGIKVEWVEFQAGPPLLEALNAGAIDFGATGDMPPIFAQAAGADLVYVGAQPRQGDNQAVLVRDGGPVQTLAELRGRRVAFTRGSSAHNVLAKVLQKAGLSFSDIQPVPLAPPDAAAAFRNGAVDAWSIWDPFLAIAQQDPATRVLIPATEISPTNNFFLAARAWANRSPDQVTAVLDAINAGAAWAKANPEALVGMMAETTGVPLAAERVAALRGSYTVQKMDDTIIAQQQDIADTFFKLRALPTRLDIRKAVWTPPAHDSGM